MSWQDRMVIETTSWSDLTSKRKAKTYKPYRKCKYKDCDMTLSQYNPNKYCHRHNKIVAYEEAINLGTRRK